MGGWGREGTRWGQVSKLASLIKNFLPGLIRFGIGIAKASFRLTHWYESNADCFLQHKAAGLSPLLYVVPMCPQQESNLHQELRSLLFYPLNYGDATNVQ